MPTILYRYNRRCTIYSIPAFVAVFYSIPEWLIRHNIVEFKPDLDIKYYSIL